MVSRAIFGLAAIALMLLAGRETASARQLKSSVTEVSQIPNLRPEFPIPHEPNMLFYIQRSVNSNTVIYSAHVDAQGHLDRSEPIDVYWRWYNVDGHQKALNFFERSMAYGVSLERHVKAPSNAVAFRVAALPERNLLLERDSRGVPEALIEIGGHLARLVYAYLQVDDHGLLPNVTAIDLFAVDTLTGKALHEHVVRN